MASTPRALFLDIGGVLLTNGWDRQARQRAVDKFGLDGDELNERHHLTFDTYEEGKLTLDEYLTRIVFYQPRSFTIQDFRQFMFDQSQAYSDMIGLVRDVKARYNLRTVAVSNEGRELTVYRIRTFKLGDIIDTFVSSCFVHLRKPDADMYRLALDVAQVEPDESIYVDDRAMFVEEASRLGMHGIRHAGYDATRQALAAAGLSLA